MKRIFPIIIVLIALSVIGIILMQISWLKNMLALREDQITQKIQDATTAVGQELSIYKGASVSSGLNNAFSLKNDKTRSFDFTKPINIAERFTTQELHDKIRISFLNYKLEDVPFEFGIATILNGIPVMERQSAHYEQWFSDSSMHKLFQFYLAPPSGSPAENFSSEEWLIVIVPKIKHIVNKDLRPRIAVAILFTLIIFTAFFLTVRTMLRQKKMSEIKNDFINNMTHEFKTPIATISLAVDALRNVKVQQDVAKMTYFSDIIKEENQRMNRQVETILKSALMDRQEIELNTKALPAHQIIQDVADNFMLRLQEKQGSLQLFLDAENDLIEADEVHFSNLVNNLMDNAVKYSRDNVPPKMSIHTSSTAKNFIIRLEDNGIGMNRETLKRIFEKFYRAHTGNLHNVKGFGLGLSYVKDIIDAHNGHIKAESTLGKGSCFTIELPLHKA